ncbi:hypothetical protein ACFYKT_18970 [Cytobacillus sp. FJAT-53684]|uniref:Uncharacterized protein n=1 Tax=Cytobacillus mangrovibacter TaxID=3299024 RepID=A0ABW6K485_9BACI
MSIRCGHCGSELEKDNYVVLDFIYTLSHINCSHVDPNLILSTGVLEDIADEYPLLNIKNPLN